MEIDVDPTPIKTHKKHRFQTLRRLFFSEFPKRLTKKGNIVDEQGRDNVDLRNTGSRIVDPGRVSISSSYSELPRPKTSRAYHEYSLPNLDQQDNYGTQPVVPPERNAVRPSTSLGVNTRIARRPVPRSSPTQQNNSQSMGMNHIIWYPGVPELQSEVTNVLEVTSNKPAMPTRLPPEMPLSRLEDTTTVGSLAVPTSPSPLPPIIVDIAPTGHQPTTALRRASTPATPPKTALPRASTIRIAPAIPPIPLRLRRVPLPSANAGTSKRQESLETEQLAESERRREQEIRETLEIERKAEFERYFQERREWGRRESERKNREDERERELAKLQKRQRQAEQAREEKERQELARKEQEERVRMRLEREDRERQEQQERERMTEHERRIREQVESERMAELERRIREQDERERQFAERQERQRQAEQARQEKERQARKEQEERQERQRQAEQARREKEREEHARKREERRQQQAALQAVGAHVAIRHINQWRSLGQGGNVRDLTLAILKQMRIIKNSFAKNLPNHTISKIEYIMNDSLYNQFNATKAEFRKSGRNTKEMLLFHGTDPQNIDRFSNSKRY